jgi:hypothetical protein
MRTRKGAAGPVKLQVLWHSVAVARRPLADSQERRRRAGPVKLQLQVRWHSAAQARRLCPSPSPTRNLSPSRLARHGRGYRDTLSRA